MSTQIEVTGWRTSTRSGGGGSGANCVEIGTWHGGVAIRDTKDREGTIFATNHREWASFLAGLKSGAFDA